MKELAELNAIYQKMSTPDVDEAMIVTNADKKGNTPAYQNYKKGMKKKDGTPMYKACLLYTSPSPRDKRQSRMPSSA